MKPYGIEQRYWMDDKDLKNRRELGRSRARAQAKVEARPEDLCPGCCEMIPLLAAHTCKALLSNIAGITRSQHR